MSNEPEAAEEPADPGAAPRGSRLARRILIAVFAAIAIGACFVGYVAYDGHRELQHELELLRASGAPEFPEQFEFPELPPGEDMVAWLHEIDLAGGEWSLEDLGACRSLAAAPGFQSLEFERACEAALRDPRRVGNLTECEVAVLDARWEADRKQLEIASRIDRVAPVDWRAIWQRGESDEAELLLQWPAGGALAAQWVLSRDAARRARRGDMTGCALRLRQGLGLIQRLGDCQMAAEFLAWAKLVEIWIEDGFLPALHALPPESGLTEFVSELEHVDSQRQLRAGWIGERAQAQRIFRHLRSAGGEADSWGSGAAPIAWLSRTMWFDGDQRTYLNLLREVLAACESGVDLSRLRDVDRRLMELAQTRISKFTRPVTLMLCPVPCALGETALRIEVEVTLARAALLARDSGTLAAKSWLAGRYDPFDASPFRVRSDPDGILVLWSVGPDGREGPPEGGGFDDDVRILVRPRER